MQNPAALIPISTLFNSKCGYCDRPVSQGVPVLWDRGSHKIYHYGCVGNEQVTRTLVLDSRGIFHLTFERNNSYLETIVQQIAGVVFDSSDDIWHIEKPSPVSARQLLDLAEQYSFEYDSRVLLGLADIIKTGTEAMLQSMAKTSSFVVHGLRHELFPFQVSGVEFGATNKRVLIADQMGLGKTIQAMGIIAHLRLFPTVVVCPAIIKLNWQRELLEWIEGINIERIFILQGRTPHLLPPADVYIINYDVLPSWVEAIKRVKPKCIVFDEFHYVKNSTSLRSKAAKEIAKDKEYVIGLSGTPILNRPEELIHPLRILNRLKEMGGKEYVEKRYCDAKLDQFKRWDTSGASNLKELNERLRSSGIFIRRTKSQVLPDLPRKMPPTIIPIALTNYPEYRKAESDLAKYLGEKAIEDAEFKKSIQHLSPIEKLRITANRKRSVEYLARRNQERSKFIHLKRISTQGKLQGVKEYINNFLENGEKLLVFGWFVDTQVDLSSTWPQAVHVLGQDSDKNRAQAIDKFQSDPNCQLLIASLKVLGIGVNLTAASHVAFVELGWTPADHDQAEDRVHRIGQTMPVNVYYFYGEDTIERDIIEIIDRKRKIISAATDGTEENDQEIIQLLIGRLLIKYGTK